MMITKEDVTHLCRLGMAGDRQGVQTYVRRMAKKYVSSSPELSQSLSELLSNTHIADPTRLVQDWDVPVDLDTRLKLLRFTDTQGFAFEPSWDTQVQNKLNTIVLEHERWDELKTAGLHPASSALFTGLPGVGKTFAAQWIASRLGKPLAVLDLSSVMSSLLGRTGTNVRHVLEYAKNADCVLLLDELDAVAKRRDDASEVGELKRLVTVLLQEIDAWPSGSLLLAATNHPNLLDPAVWRRFDYVVEFPPPSRESLRKAIRAHLGMHYNEVTEGWIDALAIVNQGRSYSDIERELIALRRSAILERELIQSKIKDFIANHISTLGRSDKKLIAAALWNNGTNGMSQRDVQEMTGVARETIRSASRENSSPVEHP